MNQFMQIFLAKSEIINGIKGHPRVIIVIVTYCRSFVLVRLKVYGTFLFVKVHILSNSLLL